MGYSSMVAGWLRHSSTKRMFVISRWMIIVMLVVSVTAVLAQDTATPAASGVAAECAKLLPAERPIQTGASAPEIRIAQPSGGALYGTAVTIAIETTHFDINQEGHHWHLWINGQLQGMVYQPTAIIDLAPGTYLICASMGNTDHADIGMPAGVEVKVMAAAAGTPTATLPVAREAAQVQPEGNLSAGQVILLVGGGLAAAVGGWWMGSRMGKKKKV